MELSSPLNKKKVDNMLRKLFTKIKTIINDIDYSLWETRIMSDALEFDEDVDIVKAQLNANYKNHYD